MKKLLALLLTIFCMQLVAQNGPQPLHVAKVVVTPDPASCQPGATPRATISVTASGGQPSEDGLYTYYLGSLANPAAVVTGRTGTFTTSVTPVSVLVSDSMKRIVAVTIVHPRSQSGSVTLSVDSLALGEGKGCVTMSVTNPAGTTSKSVQFVLADPRNTPISTTTRTNEPFAVTVPTSAQEQLLARYTIEGDCQASPFIIVFPFPQGEASALKAYLYNNYCSCSVETDSADNG